DRRSLLDGLGEVFSGYRAKAYEAGPGRHVSVPVAALRRFLSSVTPFLDQVVRTGRRTDGLFESYCLVHFEPGSAHLEPLYEMLEGQVAVLSGQDLAVEEVVHLVDTMFESPLYREDQHTFMLYPNRALPPFSDKNVVPEEALGAAARSLLDAGVGILSRDVEGRVRFDAAFRSAEPLAAALSSIDGLSPDGRREVLDLYESVFHHASFTGRSGTMYRYEGLGSVYWHMVSKLLLAVHVQVVRAVEGGLPGDVVDALADRYVRIRAGLGYQKDVVEQGTFPTDPHSHTPGHTGAQQPGMTGQVKEGVLLRWGELGVVVDGGRLRFRPVVLSLREFLEEPRPWRVLGDGGRLEAGTLGFTYCGVPVVYHLEEGAPWASVTWSDGRETRGSEHLDPETTAALFGRRGLIDRIDVGIPTAWLRSG
ncbi:MAG TPA: hypothetical protein VLD62_05455, partial [Acidimicrobiia bacterium]|nr:hypothetical protein [Acidimicrobiia bacterium]